MPDPIVEVEFYDHVFGDTKLTTCRVWGRLIQEDSHTLVLRVWEDTEFGPDSVHEHVTIVKGAVLRINRLKRTKK